MPGVLHCVAYAIEPAPQVRPDLFHAAAQIQSQQSRKVHEIVAASFELAGGKNYALSKQFGVKLFHWLGSGRDGFGFACEGVSSRPCNRSALRAITAVSLQQQRHEAP
jgi:hypothetical protein